MEPGGKGTLNTGDIKLYLKEIFFYFKKKQNCIQKILKTQNSHSYADLINT